MTIKPARVGDVTLSEDDISKALTELGNTFGLTASEVHARTLPRAGDRSAAGWASAIREVHAELRAAASQPTPVIGQRSTADMIAEYTSKYPPVDASGNRLCLTAGNGNRPAMSDADAASEISRLCLTNHQPNGRVKFDMGKVSAAALSRPADAVALSEERLYDDSSELRLTSTVNGQAAADAEVARLAASSHGGKFLNLAQGTANRTDSIDSAAPSVSDLTQQTLPPNQSWTGATFSPFAQQEFDALPDEQAQPIQAALDAAGQATGPHQAAGHLLRAMRAACGTKHLKHELGLRAHAAVDAAASYLPSTADATTQSAGGTDVASEVQRLSTLASAPAKGNTTGNVSTAPKSLAQRTAEQRAARPGYSNDPARGGFGF
jgi:hypothetical protein